MIQLNFKDHGEMLAFFDAVVAPRYVVQPGPVTVEVAAVPAQAPVVAKEEPKAPKQPKAAKPAATQPVSETATPAPMEPAAIVPAAESPSEPGVKITLEFVRAKLADLSKAGKAAECKALIAETGASNLSSVPPEKFAELLNKAAAL